MHKIILDTNVIVSALISDSFPKRILDELVFSKLVSVCLSPLIAAEYVDVLNRAKFAKYKDFKIKSDIVIKSIIELSQFYNPPNQIKVSKDISDNKFLDLALTSQADYLITGNIKDFPAEEFYTTKIVTPSAYWHIAINHK